ncbi:uncharacterized protein LOC134564406 [Prinia subflava]|uniref:uncharacterized protein LOC134564406 n=1 Tax=Prinia subflava TaxID=208062 RepID=UPI002FE411D7
MKMGNSELTLFDTAVSQTAEETRDRDSLLGAVGGTDECLSVPQKQGMVLSTAETMPQPGAGGTVDGIAPPPLQRRPPAAEAPSHTTANSGSETRIAAWPDPPCHLRPQPGAAEGLPPTHTNPCREDPNALGVPPQPTSAEIVDRAQTGVLPSFPVESSLRPCDNLRLAKQTSEYVHQTLDKLTAAVASSLPEPPPPMTDDNAFNRQPPIEHRRTGTRPRERSRAPVPPLRNHATSTSHGKEPAQRNNVMPAPSHIDPPSAPAPSHIILPSAPAQIPARPHHFMDCFITPSAHVVIPPDLTQDLENTNVSPRGGNRAGRHQTQDTNTRHNRTVRHQSRAINNTTANNELDSSITDLSDSSQEEDSPSSDEDVPPPLPEPNRLSRRTQRESLTDWAAMRRKALREGDLEMANEPPFVMPIRAHSSLPGFLAEGNARADELTVAVILDPGGFQPKT